MDNKLLDDIKAAGALAYPREDVVRMLGLTAIEEDFLYDDRSELGRAYWAGYYASDLKWRKSVFDLASKGSSPAQAMVKRMMQELEMRQFYEQ